jgi:Heterokaryon incompatibility protein (HET)
MRLLQLDSYSSFSLAEFAEDQIPRYAILSHTWGSDGDEVTYKDIIDGTGSGKAGYDKLHFCADQAKNDGLSYCWIDTCCNIQTHHRRQRLTKRVAYAAENGGRTYIAFLYKIRIIYPHSP